MKTGHEVFGGVEYTAGGYPASWTFERWFASVEHSIGIDHAETITAVEAIAAFEQEMSPAVFAADYR